MERHASIAPLDGTQAAMDQAAEDHASLSAALETALADRDATREALERALAGRDASHEALTAMIDIAMSHRFPRERKGRNVQAGNLRGWHIEFGQLLKSVRDFPDFQAALAACEGCNLLGDGRLLNLYLIIKFGLPLVPGDLIEFGTYRGGSALFVASLLKSMKQDRVLYACDTFSGMPETNLDIDMHHAGDFADTSYEVIMKRVRSLGLEQHLVLVKGRFEDTLPALRQGKKFSLVHVDCDIYDSIIFVLRNVQEYLALGAYVVFDDPLYSSCLGAMEAVEEFYIQGLGLHTEQVYPHMVFRPRGVE
jgi:predicted O-methyltransferase YrrM